MAAQPEATQTAVSRTAAAVKRVSLIDPSSRQGPDQADRQVARKMGGFRRRPSHTEGLPRRSPKADRQHPKSRSWIRIDSHAPCHSTTAMDDTVICECPSIVKCMRKSISLRHSSIRVAAPAIKNRSGIGIANISTRDCMRYPTIAMLPGHCITSSYR